MVDAGVKQDPKRITGTPFWYDEPGSSPRRGSDVHHSAICWVNCVKISTYTYLLISPNDPDGEDWCAMDGVLSHINQVEAYARLDSKSFGSLHSRLVEAESSIRHEWHRVAQQDQGISLDDAVELSMGYTHSLITLCRSLRNSIVSTFLSCEPNGVGPPDVVPALSLYSPR